MGISTGPASVYNKLTTPSGKGWYGLLILCCLLLRTPPLLSQTLPKPNQPFSLSPSNPSVLCSFDQLMAIQRKTDGFNNKELRMNNEIRRISNNVIDTIITLPVVFHIVNPNPAGIPDQTIIDAVKDLNDAFGKTGSYSGSTGVDTKIRFCLAKKAPDGGVTNGINRITSPYANNLNMYNEDVRLKQLAQWPPNRYINIWLVTNISGEISAEFSCDVWTRLNAGGYATMPPAGGSTNGIVITGFGSLLAHEMGHYLGLYHTFEGGCTNNNCETDGDKVCDTPPDGTANYAFACTSPPVNSCSSDTLSAYSNGYFVRDTTDLTYNFMDYGNSGCANQFTNGQALRMRAAINTQRTGLLENKCTDPCNTTAIASFTRNSIFPKTGDLVGFTNNSTGATSYEWLVDNVVVSTANNYSHTFTIAGKYIVTLKAYNGATCFASYRDEVIVSCGVAARFFTDKKSIASKVGILLDSIYFTNQSENATSYQWLFRNSSGMSEQVVATTQNLNYVFNIPSTYFVRLIASNGACSDTTDTFGINVFDPTPDGVVYLNSADCYEDTKARVRMLVCNNGYAPIPNNTPISFYDADPRTTAARKVGSRFLLPDSVKGRCCGIYYTHIIDIGYPKLNKLYLVFNDTGAATPISLPNTGLNELNYNNNISATGNIAYRAIVSPLDTTLEPGDTLQITSYTTTNNGSSTFLWSDAKRLSCTTCASPLFYADSSRLKRLTVTSNYQCHDTAFVNIKVPPADDYQITINSIVCLSNDSLQLNFTLSNTFKRGVLPAGLSVSFYKGDPRTDTAALLPPIFQLTDTVKLRSATFSKVIKSIGRGTIYASVNDNGNFIRIQPSSRFFVEKIDTNNINTFNYLPYTTVVNATICSNDNYFGYTQSGTYVDVFGVSNACDSIRTLYLTVNPVKYTNINVAICKGDSLFVGGAYQKTRGTYTDTLQTFTGCDSIVVTNLFLADLPSQFLPADTIVCRTADFLVDVPHYTAYLWSDGSTQNPLKITQPGSYYLQVRDKYGCYGTDSMTVAFTDCIEIGIPNAFTPNGDGKNDQFKPLVPVPLEGYRLQIWNRWGAIVFESRNPSIGWDGNYAGVKQASGTYVYRINFKSTNGSLQEKAGTLVLIR